MKAEAALQILRDARDRSHLECVKTDEVRAALSALVPLCTERWPLEWFWECAGSPNEIGRSQNLNAAYRGILLQMDRAPD